MRLIDEVVRDISPSALENASVTAAYVMVKCPFHGGGTERTPSCSLSRSKPVFFCHACSTGGHISRYLRAIGASKDYAKNAVEKVDYDYSEFGDGAGRKSMYSGKVNRFRGEFILDDDLLDGWRLRPQALFHAGFKERTLRHFEVGVDHARARITFPLRNLYGELVGVSGRTMVENTEGPRYKVYSAKDLEEFGVPANYTTQSIKSSLLWHAHLVYPICFKTREPIVICEGFKAAMWVWQAGLHNVVALVGASLSMVQAELLARTASDVILFLDNNTAGKIGTHKAAEKLLAKNITKVAKYPDLRPQPDALTEAEVQHAVTASVPYSRWRLTNRKEKRSTDRAKD
jgi:DNA primase